MPPSEVVSLCLFTKHTWLGTGRWTCHWKLPQQVALTVLKAQVKAIVRVLIATLSVDRTTYWRVVHKSLSWRTSLDLFIWPDLALHNHSQLPMTGYQRRRPADGKKPTWILHLTNVFYWKAIGPHKRLFYYEHCKPMMWFFFQPLSSVRIESSPWANFNTSQVGLNNVENQFDNKILYSGEVMLTWKTRQSQVYPKEKHLWIPTLANASIWSNLSVQFLNGSWASCYEGTPTSSTYYSKRTSQSCCRGTNHNKETQNYIFPSKYGTRKLWRMSPIDSYPNKKHLLHKYIRKCLC